MRVKIDTTEWKQTERELRNVKERAIPFATRATLNATAFNARKEAGKIIKRNMITRNNFTVKSVRVEKVGRELIISRMSSEVGSIADYMKTQEEGSTESKRGSVGVPIATSFSSGEGISAQPRRRLPRKPNKLSSIKLTRTRGKPKSRKQENFLRVKQAVESGKRFVYMETSRNKGIYRIQGSGRPNKQGKLPRVKIRMVWNLKQTSVVIPKSPWLKPASDKAVDHMLSEYNKALQFQLDKL